MLATKPISTTVSFHVLEAVRPLGLLSDIPLTDAQESQLVQLENYDLWFVAERLVKKRILSLDIIDEAILEYKRYMALLALGHTHISVVNEDVDEVWHAFILFTKDYAAFCEQVFGKFMHHVPRTSRSAPNQYPKSRVYDLYEQHFGENPMWYSRADASGDCTVDPQCDTGCTH